MQIETYSHSVEITPATSRFRVDSPAGALLKFTNYNPEDGSVGPGIKITHGAEVLVREHRGMRCLAIVQPGYDKRHSLSDPKTQLHLILNQPGGDSFILGYND